MNSYVIAALLGFASVASGQWADTLGPYGSNGYQITFDYATDFQYGTHYYNGQEDDTTTGETLEAYGVNTYAYATLNFQIDFDTWGTYRMDHTFYPFYVIPIEQRTYFTRPESTLPKTAYMQLVSSIDLLFVETEVTEDYKTFTISAYAEQAASGDFLPSSADWVLGNSESSFDDPFHSLNIFEDFILDPSWTWYGETIHHTQTFY